ncbi:MAG TPA: lmo0937 family membrane protein [Bacteroidales bacterium]|nr:lmo0937 family membrane protein [Bacteroidales bacterium]
MGYLLYLIAIVFLIAWAVGYLVYDTGGILHVLLVIAIIAVLLRIIFPSKTGNN